MTRSFLATALGAGLACTVPGGEMGDAADGTSTGSAEATGDTASSGIGTSEGSTGCAGACPPTGSGPAESSSGGPSEFHCDDAFDNDGDMATDCEDPDCLQDEACSDATVRFMTWNVLRVGAPGSGEFEALANIVTRLDPDIVCLQEVGGDEEANLQALSEQGGYDYGLLAPASGPPGEEIANACLSRFETADEAYLWSDWISSDPDARDVTRPFVRLRIYHPASARYVSVVAGHLKAGTQEVDAFRRMVDAIRLAQAAQAESDMYPDNAVIALGDLNETPDPPAQTFSALPAGLPEFYQLGDDIELPITYAPEQPLLDAGLSRVEARWEDATEDATFIPTPRRLDYIYVSGEDVVVSEVYEACQDDGVDDAPQGDVLPKVGAPLDCGLSEVAADHRPVVVDLLID